MLTAIGIIGYTTDGAFTIHMHDRRTDKYYAVVGIWPYARSRVPHGLPAMRALAVVTI